MPLSGQLGTWWLRRQEKPAAKHTLEQNGQEHVLRFWDQLNEQEHEVLLEQLAALDFDSIARMKTMLAASLFASAGTAAPTLRTAPIRSTSKLPFQESSSTPFPPLGLETRMSRPPRSAMAAAMKPSRALSACTLS